MNKSLNRSKPIEIEKCSESDTELSIIDEIQMQTLTFACPNAQQNLSLKNNQQSTQNVFQTQNINQIPQIYHYSGKKMDQIRSVFSSRNDVCVEPLTGKSWMTTNCEAGNCRGLSILY